MELDLHKARQQRDFNALLQALPYARFLGMHCISVGEEVIFVLPAAENNVGNPSLPAIHGGAVGGFLECAAGCYVLGTIASDNPPKVIDFSLDYLRPCRFQETYAVCEIVRQGRKVVNVIASAWQEQRSVPVANARTHLLI